MSETQTLTVRQAAISLGCTLQHVYNLVRVEKLAGAHKEDGQWKVPFASLEKYLATRKRGRTLAVDRIAA